MSACTHPAESVTWNYKGPGRTVAIINGQIHGTCDDCGAAVIVTPEPGWNSASSADLFGAPEPETLRISRGTGS